jgi:hypothetical protein
LEILPRCNLPECNISSRIKKEWNIEYHQQHPSNIKNSIVHLRCPARYSEEGRNGKEDVDEEAGSNHGSVLAGAGH